MEPDTLVLVTFPVSCFGHMPVVMKLKIWNEIYTAYEDVCMVTIDDDNGETIEIDICECVHNAYVVQNPSEDIISWADAVETNYFFNYVCMEYEEEAYGLQLEINFKITPLILVRGGIVDDTMAVGLGTMKIVFQLGGKSRDIVSKYIDGEKHYIISDDESSFHVVDISDIEKYLDGIEPVKMELEDVNVRPTLEESTANVDLSMFDDIEKDLKDE